MKCILKALITIFILGISNSLFADILVTNNGSSLKGDIDQSIIQATKDWTFKFELIEASYQSSLQKNIDNTYEQIFAQKSAEPFCAIFPAKDTTLLKLLTGVSSSSARKIEKQCRSIKKTPHIIDKVTGKGRVFFVFTNTENFPLQGWSNNLGHTFLFFKDRQSITNFELVKSLSHELSIKVDFKSFLTFYMGLNDFEETWVNRNTRVEYNPSNNCRSINIFLNPVIRNHFLAERAREFEFKLIKEIFNSEIEDAYKKLDCSSRLIANIEQLSAINNTFNDETENLNYKYKLKKINCPNESEGERLLNDLLFLKTEKIYFKGKSIPLCEFLSTPWIQVLPYFLNNGPGPRIGGGWKTTTPENTQLIQEEFNQFSENANNQEEPNKENLKHALIDKLDKMTEKKIESYK